MPDNFNIFLMGDDHEGNLLRYTKGFDKFLEIVCSEWNGVDQKDNYIVHHGDPMEGIMVDDPRFDPLTCKNPIPLEQMKSVINNYKPVANKMITMLEGNHPWKLHRFGHLTKQICEELGIPYGTWTAKIAYLDNYNELMFKSFHTHGRKNIGSACDDIKRRKVNMLLALKRHLKDQVGDCALMAKGHTHRLLVSEPESEVYMTDNGDEIQQCYTLPEYTNQDFADDETRREIGKPSQGLYNAPYIYPDNRWYVNTGSFLKSSQNGVSGYAEMFEYAPIELGFAVAEIRNKTIQNVRSIFL